MVNMNCKISPRCPGAAFQRLLFLYLLLIYYILGWFFVAEMAFDRISACPLLFWGFWIPLLTPFAPFISEYHPKPKWTFLPASVRSQMMSTLSHPLHPALASKPAFPIAVLPFSMYLFSHPSRFLISLLTDFAVLNTSQFLAFPCPCGTRSPFTRCCKQVSLLSCHPCHLLCLALTHQSWHLLLLSCSQTSLSFRNSGIIKKRHGKETPRSHFQDLTPAWRSLAIPGVLGFFRVGGNAPWEATNRCIWLGWEATRSRHAPSQDRLPAKL